MALAIQIQDTGLIVKSYLDKAQSYDALNLKLDAMRNYLNAKDLAEYSGNHDLEIACYTSLLNFYFINRMYNKADEYNQNQINLVKSRLPVDSVALMWSLCFMHVIHNQYNNSLLTEQGILRSIDFAIRTKNNRLKQYEFASLRTYCIDNFEF